MNHRDLNHRRAHSERSSKSVESQRGRSSHILQKARSCVGLRFCFLTNHLVSSLLGWWLFGAKSAPDNGKMWEICSFENVACSGFWTFLFMLTPQCTTANVLWVESWRGTSTCREIMRLQRVVLHGWSTGMNPSVITLLTLQTKTAMGSVPTFTQLAQIYFINGRTVHRWPTLTRANHILTAIDHYLSFVTTTELIINYP